MSSINLFPYSQDFQGVELLHDSGSSVKLLRYGAHIYSWKTKGVERLFLSKTAEFKPGKAIRGGIPIVFPQFSRRGPLPAHGFARNSEWELVQQEISNDSVAVTLQLKANEQTRVIWPYDFELNLRIELSDELKLILQVKNTGASSFSFSDAFHTYFLVEDIRNVRLSGLQGTTKIDLLDSESESLEDSNQVVIAKATDTIYKNSPDLVSLVQGESTLQIIKQGMTDTVVWNPWDEGNKKIQDLHPDAWKRMICVESANALGQVTLEAGEFHESVQVFRII